MKITIYRPNQIGGCITEIESESGTRIIIDVGTNLPGVESEPVDVEALTSNSDGVFISHYHGDHIGDHKRVDPNVDIYMGKIAKEIFYTLQERLALYKDTGITAADLNRIQTFRTYTHGNPINIKDLVVTPLSTDHSAFDSYMLLIEGDGKRVLYTGDFRSHGKVGENSFKYIEDKIGKVDTLIVEGTMLSKSSENVMTEESLQAKAVDIIKAHKYVFIMCSSTNIDRIAAFYHANKAGDKLFVVDEYQKKVLDTVTKTSGEYDEHYDFTDCVSFDGDKYYDDMRAQGFCMLIRNNIFSKKFLNSYHFKTDQVVIYSMWKGYLEGKTKDKRIYEPLPKDDDCKPIYKYLHTSGHATEDALIKICEITTPDTIIPIHSENTDKFRELNIQSDVRVLDNGERIIF